MSQPIIFYDIPSSNSKRKSWSPNVWKARLALNIKGVPHITKWIEFQDIEPLATKYGLTPPGKYLDGRTAHTLPMIYDPNTKTAVSDSVEVAKYLDKTYPTTPPLWPAGTHALRNAFLDSIMFNIGFPLACQIMVPECRLLSPQSREYAVGNMPFWFGKPLEQLADDAQWQAVEKGLGQVKDWMNTNGSGKDNLLMGDHPVFADLQLVAFFIWSRAIFGDDSENFKRIMGWHDGKWKQYLAGFEKYTTIS